jgi:hypothetical protein
MLDCHKPAMAQVNYLHSMQIRYLSICYQAGLSFPGLLPCPQAPSFDHHVPARLTKDWTNSVQEERTELIE